MTSFIVQARERKVRGKNQIQLLIPQRLLTYLRATRPGSVQVVFGSTFESFEIDSKAFQELLEKSYKNKRKK